MLGGLGLQLAGGLDERHVGDVHKNCVATAILQRKFADGFEERQAFDVAGGAADFGDDNVRAAFFGHGMHAVFDFIGHVRNHLHGLAEIIAAPFFFQNRLVHAPTGEVIELREF